MFLLRRLNRLLDSFESKAYTDLLSGFILHNFHAFLRSNPVCRRNPSLYYVHIECLLSFSQRLRL